MIAEVAQASRSSKTQDERETCAFRLSFGGSRAIVVWFGRCPPVHCEKQEERKANQQTMENTLKNPPKRSRNRRKIDEKSILGRFRRPKPFWGRVRTRSGRLWDAQVAPQSRPGDAPGDPRAARRRPKASPGQLRGAPRASGTHPKTLVGAVRVAKRSQKRCGLVLERFRSTRGCSEV